MQKFTVSPTGEIIVDDVPTDNLRLVDFAENVKLKKEGSTLFKAPNGATPTDSTATIVQGRQNCLMSMLLRNVEH